MAYTKKTWKDFPNASTPITAEDLQNIEDGIEDIDNRLSGIIETGSNSNGYYQKYADGTLVQRGIGSCPSGIGYAGITFPVAFFDSDYIIIANHKYTGGGSYGGSLQLRNITIPQANNASTAFIYSYLYDGTIASYIRNVQYVAYGRWK